MFPSLSAIQDDKSSVRYIYIKATRYIAAVTFPLMMGLLVVAPQFIMVVFGPQWERSILLVQILTLVGLMHSIGTTVGWIYQSQGRTDIMFRWGIFSVAVIAIAFVLGLRGDVEGVTIAYAIATLFLAYPSFAIPFKLINLKFSYFIKQFRSIILATIGLGGITFALRLFMETSLGASDLVILIVTAVVGAVSYAGLLFVLDKNLYLEVFLYEHMSGKKNNAQLIGLLLTFELFNRMFIDGEKI
jgi:PST family polysaccharide transporter